MRAVREPMSSFRLSLNASTIRGTELLRQIEVAAEAGFEGIELWFADLDRYLATGGSVKDVRRALDTYGLGVPTVIYLGGWFDATEEEWTAKREECRVRMGQAAELGAKYVIASPPKGGMNLNVGAARYAELLEIGRSEGPLPAMEFLGFVQELNTIEAALAVLDRVGAPDATTVVDPFHIFRGGGAVESLAKLRPGQIAVAHFNDAPDVPERALQHDGDRVWPGDGHLDLGRYLGLLREIGYDGWLSLELFREEYWRRDPLEVAREGITKMRRVVSA